MYTSHAHRKTLVVVLLGLDREDLAVPGHDVLHGPRRRVEVATPVGPGRYVGCGLQLARR